MVDVYKNVGWIPHGVEKCPILHDPKQFVWHGHVVCHRLLAIVEESVRCPDLTGHQIIEP